MAILRYLRVKKKTEKTEDFWLDVHIKYTILPWEPVPRRIWR